MTNSRPSTPGLPSPELARSAGDTRDAAIRVVDSDDDSRAFDGAGEIDPYEDPSLDAVFDSRLSLSDTDEEMADAGMYRVAQHEIRLIRLLVVPLAPPASTSSAAIAGHTASSSSYTSPSSSSYTSKPAVQIAVTVTSSSSSSRTTRPTIQTPAAAIAQPSSRRPASSSSSANTARPAIVETSTAAVAGPSTSTRAPPRGNGHSDATGGVAPSTPASSVAPPVKLLKAPTSIPVLRARQPYILRVPDLEPLPPVHMEVPEQFRNHFRDPGM